MIRPLELDIQRDADGQPYLHFSLVVMSDIHLGTKYARARKTTKAAQCIRGKKRVFNGDIIDGENMRLKDHWNFPFWHQQLIGTIYEQADQGTKTVLQGGNHDLELRRVLGRNIYGLKIADRHIHADPQGRNFLIVHGDCFDPTLESCGPLGNALLDLMQELDDRIQKVPGCSHMSPAAASKKLVKHGINFFWNIRRNIAACVDADPTLAGIITGHTHLSEISYTPAGKLQMNSGCCTAQVEMLVQDENGTFGLIEWHNNYMIVRQYGLPAQTYTWDKMSLPEFKEPPRITGGIYAQRVEHTVKLIKRVYPPKPTVASITERWRITAREVGSRAWQASLAYLPTRFNKWLAPPKSISIDCN